MTDLGSEGNHASVFNIGDNTNYITNSVLAFIQCHMPSRDKQFIKGKTCSIFSLNQLREARERLFKYHDPNIKYKYNGPHSKNERDKILDAFEGIYNKLTKLDAEKKMPTFTVSSTDLLILLNANGADKITEGHKHSDCDRKFEYVEKQLEEIKKTFHSFVTVVTSNSSSIPQAKSIPPVIRQRLLSTSSKRSASEMSEDEDDNISITPSVEVNPTDGFQIPKRQQQKVKRAKRTSNQENGSNPLYSAMAKKPRSKPPSTWGTTKSTSTLKGAVPDIFLYNCDSRVTTEDVQDHFCSVNINIKSIQKMSHENSQRSSFKLSLTSQNEYDQILDPESGKLPEGIAARKYIPPRWKPSDSSKIISQSQVSSAFRSSRIQELLQQANDLPDELSTNAMDVNNEEASNKA